MHDFEAFDNLVEAPADEILRQISPSRQDEVSKRATLHELQEDPDAILEVENFFTVDQIILFRMLVQVHDQTAFVDDVLALHVILRIRVL